MTRYSAVPGEQFGRLTLLKRVDLGEHNSRWLCRCICGNESIVLLNSLRRGLTKSCGCLNKELASARATTHGYSKRRLYRTEYGIWSAILRRCLNPNAPEYKNYGARGIGVCARWEKFSNFLADMGPRPPGLTLDRIDNEGDYAPENCQWATWTQQARNRRGLRVVIYEGKPTLLIEAIEKSGLTYSAVITRIHRGWPEDKWFIPPLR